MGEAINHQLQWLNGRYTPERMKSRLLHQTLVLNKLIPYCEGATIVEVGTGWELIAPIILHLFGAKRIYTFDHVRHLRSEIPRIVIMQLDADELRKNATIPRDVLTRRIESLRSCINLDQILTVLGVVYAAPADACATGLPAHSIDMVFSYEVLEHVPEAILECLIAESKRILKPSGIAYHAIEPGDHYTRDVSHINHFKYPEWIWAPLIKNSISYHNRLSVSQFVSAFEKHGATIEYQHNDTSETDLMILKDGFRRDTRFSQLTPEDLAVWHSEIICRFP